jgi:hypothetical protein
MARERKRPSVKGKSMCTPKTSCNREEKERTMVKERKRMPKQHQLARDESKKFELEEHLQPTETYNPKTQTQCAKKRL